jgi:hypothetical protein
MIRALRDGEVGEVAGDFKVDLVVDGAEDHEAPARQVPATARPSERHRRIRRRALTGLRIRRTGELEHAYEIPCPTRKRPDR